MGRLGGGTRERLGERERAACPAQGETRADDVTICVTCPNKATKRCSLAVLLPLSVVTRRLPVHLRVCVLVCVLSGTGTPSRCGADSGNPAPCRRLEGDPFRESSWSTTNVRTCKSQASKRPVLLFWGERGPLSAACRGHSHEIDNFAGPEPPPMLMAPASPKPRLMPAASCSSITSFCHASSSAWNASGL